MSSDFAIAAADEICQVSQESSDPGHTCGNLIIMLGMLAVYAELDLMEKRLMQGCLVAFKSA